MALVSNIPLSSSSSSNTSRFKHDVFISFRGEDTRYNFTSHLDRALRDKQIQTYIDYKLKRGDEISPSLLKAIEESQISVIIFSKDYASSSWCLQELVKILECKKGYGQIVIPVFYNVVPSDVRNQTGTFGDAFTKHDQLCVSVFSFRVWVALFLGLFVLGFLGCCFSFCSCFGALFVAGCSLVSWVLLARFSCSKKKQQSSGQVQIWKDALREAANLSGLDSSTIKDESVLIKNIVEDILKRLNAMSSSDSKGLVGIDTKIEQIVSLLGRQDVHSVGIWGIGGIGKTTLAEVVFNRISSQFEGSCFVPNIRETSEQSGGLNHQRVELLSTLLEDRNLNIGTAFVRHAFTRDRLRRKKLLIVFDDVTDFRQIENLIGGFDCLNPQSRIIITTRDKKVLINWRVDQVYEVQELFHREALELFRRHAFKENHLSEDYIELSERVFEYTGGVPLALEVLGSFLCDNSEQEWKSALSKLERIANKRIQDVLKISYDGLDDDEVQRIFLDIACFFKGTNKDFVINILNAFGFSAEIGIKILSDKSLISLSKDNIITMHDLLQAMAREIVRQESVELGKRSRLWDYDDIYRVLTKDKGTEMIEAISLDMSSSNVRDINLSPWAFVKMEKLRLLEFYVSNVWCKCNHGNKVHVPDEGFESVFTELKYLHWYGFPSKSLQPSFQLKSLVILEMPNSDLEELWSGFTQLFTLKRIDLTGSKQLNRCPDFSGTPNLKSLMLDQCTSLSEIPSSIQHLTKLESLSLNSCKSLTSIPNCSGLKSLKGLILGYCTKLKRLPELPNNLEILGVEGCKSLVEIPSSFKYLNKVESLNLRWCESLESIPDLRGWKSLKELDGSQCYKLKMLPEVPNNIERLALTYALIEELPPSFEDLHSLESLNLCYCSKFDKLPDNIGTLESLKSIDATGTAVREIPPSISCLKRLEYLDLSGCKGEDGVGLILPPLSGLDNLRQLNLSDCGIKEIPPSISCLKRLSWLDLSGCKGEDGVGLILPPLSGLDHLGYLDLSDCGIKELPDLGCLTSLGTLILAKNNFESIPGSLSKQLLHIDISNCERIKVLPKLQYWTCISAVNCKSLEELLSHSFQIFRKTGAEYRNDFTNCFKLNRTSLNYFLEGIVQEMKRLATSIVRRHASVPFGELPPLSTCYPENDIPEWFSFRSTRSFIDVKLPPHWFNCNFICLALSFVVMISNPDYQCDHQEVYHHRYSKVKYEAIVKSKDGDRCFNRIDKSLEYYCSFFQVPNCGPDCIKSNHVIIGFGYSFVRDLCDDEFSFRFYVDEDTKESNIEHIKVVKCGVHLIFGLNLETSRDDAPQEIEYDDEFSSGDDDDDEFSSGDDTPQEIEYDDEFSSGDDDEFSSGDDAPQEIETYRITPRDQGC